MGAEPGATGTWGANGAHGVTTAVPLASGLQWNGFRFCRENANFMSSGDMKTLAWARQNPGAGGSVRARAGGRWGTGADCAASSCCQWLRAPADTRMVPLCHPWCPSSSLHVKDMAFSLQRSQRISSMRYIRNDERVPGALSQPVHPNSRITPYCQAPAFRSRELEARQGECSC